MMKERGVLRAVVEGNMLMKVEDPVDPIWVENWRKQKQTQQIAKGGILQGTERLCARQITYPHFDYLVESGWELSMEFLTMMA
jgi:hypothetical protein